MNILLDTSLAAGYKSRSQQARRLTEGWFERYMYCPQCPDSRFSCTTGSNPVVDFVCCSCGAEFQIKSKSSPFGAKLRDAAYEPMIERIRQGRCPHFAFIHYARDDWAIVNLFLVPGHFMTPSVIEKCKPLSVRARRAGWVGCSIITEAIPPDGRLTVIRNRGVVPEAEVRTDWQRYLWLAKQKVEARGWTADVLRCVRTLGTREFVLSEVYVFAGELAAAHPGNRHIKDKIRQQLQILRDHGIIKFLGHGRYIAT